jgi:O-antigen ligase
MLIGLRILARRKFSWSDLFRRNPVLVAFLIYIGISIVWSNYPYISFKRYIKVLASVTMALVVLSNDRPLESILTVLRRCLYVHLPMSIVCIRYYRPIGITFDWSGTAVSWQGISTTKNTLGQIAMLGVLYFAWEVWRNWSKKKWRNLHLIYLLMALYLIKGSDDALSLTSLVVCALAVVVFFRLQSLRSRIPAARRFAIIAALGTASLLILIVVHGISNFSKDSLLGTVITTFGRDITLTDRTLIWHDVYAAASGNPLLGVGYGGFWIGREANIPWAANLTWVLGQGHSGYVDTYLQVGIIGWFFLAATLITTFRNSLANLETHFDLSSLRITLLIVIAFINITETTFLRGDHQLWFIFLLAIWEVATRKPTPASLQASG